MRLYRILGAAWAGTQADAKRLAGEHVAPWHETDVPTTKPELLAWLNDRNVPAQPEEAHQVGALREKLARDPLDQAPSSTARGSATKDPPRVAPAFLGDAESQTEFVPVAKAAEIDRLLERCPQCHHTEAAARAWVDRATFPELLAWIDAKATPLELDELADLIERKRA